jgi:DNA-binding beta-propeller fold protein YncE
VFSRAPRVTGSRRRAGALAVALLLVAAAGCGGRSTPAARTDTPEPAVSPPIAAAPAGTVVSRPGEPEGLAFDAQTGVLAVGVRNPDGVALLDAGTGAERARIPLNGAPRHLELVGPGGPLLAPAEGGDRLYQLSLPDGTVLGDTGVGRQPHDAAAASGGSIFVGDELADAVTVIAPSGGTRTLPAPVQPGGVAVSADGSVVVVVGVRGRRIEAYGSDGRSLGTAACGVGPTHVRAGPGGLFYVADTQGGRVLVFEAGRGGVRQVGSASTGGGAPYGLAVDATRNRLYVTLTGTNTLRSYRMDGRRLVADRTWPTVRQPNDVAVDPTTGRVIVAGTAEGQLQFILP